MTAFAIKSFNKIDIRTVGPTRRSAITNWLVVTAGVMVYRHHNDQQIELLWNGTRGKDHDVIEVDVTEKADPLSVKNRGANE
jgi:hypothetical protein